MGSNCKRRQLNNQGFSLVELIVIMIIIVILATTVIVSFVNTADQKVKSSATLITKYMDNVLSSAMSKGNAWFKIRYDDDKDNYYVEDSEGHSEKLSSNVTVSYDVENGDKGVKIDETNSQLMFSYSRVNGSFTPIIDSVNPDGTFNYKTKGEGYAYPDKIYVTCNDSRRTIQLYVKTGVYEIVEN